MITPKIQTLLRDIENIDTSKCPGRHIEALKQLLHSRVNSLMDLAQQFDVECKQKDSSSRTDTVSL